MLLTTDDVSLMSVTFVKLTATLQHYYSESNIFIPNAIIPPVHPVTTAMYSSPDFNKATVETIPSVVIDNNICGFILLRNSPNSFLRSGGIPFGLFKL